MSITKEEAQDFFHSKTTFHIGSFHLERLTEKVYGKSIEVIDSPNDTTHAFNIDGVTDEDSKETLQLAMEEGILECYSYDIVLNDLVSKGLIEPGEYFMRVSW